MSRSVIFKATSNIVSLKIYSDCKLLQQSTSTKSHSVTNTHGLCGSPYGWYGVERALSRGEGKICRDEHVDHPSFHRAPPACVAQFMFSHELGTLLIFNVFKRWLIAAKVELGH